MHSDEDVRTACFLALDVLRAQLGDDLPYQSGLDRGFAYRGARVPFLNRQKGIYHAAVQRGPAALSIQTSVRSPYLDEPTSLGFLYAYRSGSADQPDNRALREAFALNVPLVYFVGTRAGWYRPLYPCFVTDDDPAAGRVLVSPGRMIGPMDEREAVPLSDLIERRYAVRETRIRLHQARFRGLVLPAYRDRCTICRLKEVRLLDAAHIAVDADPAGEPVVANGVSLCTIHHRAFDQDLVGISPDYEVHVAPRLLDDEDGPMLDLLKGFHRTRIEVPTRAAYRPDPERLALRFDRFLVSEHQA
ncbi:MAG: HNH endonuclease [Gaiellaceae bacterium]